MSAIDCGLGSCGETGLDEALHFGGVVESEGWVGGQSDEDVVGVNVGVADLLKGGLNSHS